VNVISANTKLFEHHYHGQDRLVDGRLFIRPHDVEVQTSPDDSTVWAVVERLVHLGWEVQVELRLADEQLITAHFSREQFDALNLKVGQIVFVKPKATKAFAAAA
jgi:sulfate transport system ATP-binding protein